MPPSNRVIIDTDPGVDDVLAILLALASKPEEIEVLLLSITFGNIDVQNCLRNVISLFHVIEKEFRWRQSAGLPGGFETLRRSKPIVAVGADRPLDDQLMMADYFHGTDGLGGIHSSHPHHTPAEEIWKDLFKAPPPDALLTSAAIQEVDIDPSSPTSLFTPSHHPSHLELLRILDENPPDSITVIAIGPLTNLALAASHAPTTLMRAKSILVMGGTISEPGNITPVAEFNTYADTVAAARLYALTSPNPASTMPPTPPPARRQINNSNDEPPPPPFLPPYPSKHELGARRLRIVLFPLDTTTPHYLRRDEVEAKVKPLIEKGSPLAEWTSAFLGSTFNKMETLHHGHEGGSAALSLHDPLCVWYALTAESQREGWTVKEGEDVRVETSGQWTRGMCVVDRRDRKWRDGDDGEGGEIPGDTGAWLSKGRGNRLGRCIGTPGERALAPFLLDRIFG